jgi:hypothetical protein
MGNTAWEEVTVRKDIDDPSITINSPNMNDLFGPTSPDFDVTISDPSGIDTQWYTIDGGTTNFTFSGSNGSIDQTAWEGKSNGTVTIRFYANDSVGNIAWEEVTVRKDSEAPSITINNPILNELFGNDSPAYNVEIGDINSIDSMWYTLNDGVKTFFTTNGTISQSIWNSYGSGDISIKFYANDSVGNEAFSEVTVEKDLTDPTIIINNPDPGDLFGHTPPNFNVRITDLNGISEMWYTLNDGVKTFFTINGTISQSIWDSYASGDISIKFYANDSVGNEAFSSVVVEKDIDGPTITINFPNPYDLFGDDAPSFNVYHLEFILLLSTMYTLKLGASSPNKSYD